MYHFDQFFFSRKGSYLAVDNDKHAGGLKVSTVRNSMNPGVNQIFRIANVDTASAEFTPWELHARFAEGEIHICLFNQDSLYIRGQGAALVLEYPDYPDRFIANYHYYCGKQLFLCDYNSGAHQCYSPVRGTVAIDAPRKTGAIRSDYMKVILQPDEQGEYEIAVEHFFSPSLVLTYMDHPYEQCVAEAKADYLQWEQQLQCRNSADCAAAYSLWSNIVGASGHYRHDTVLMSKAGMAAIWSWDNCINAMALAKYDFELAYEQFILPYRFMDDYGCTPDYVRYDSLNHVYVKPPIQGFIYPYLVRMNKRFDSTKVLSDVYTYVRQNTEWWIRMRGEMPYYLHGNDSGADNATCFDVCEVVSTPELAALLSIQCDFLARTAERLGLLEDSRKYHEQSNQYAKTAIDAFFDGALYVREAFGPGKMYSNSLLPLRMLVLGNRLPKEIREYILERLKHHLCYCGLASEALDSPHYTLDGYWRGPTWAPDQVIFALALIDLDEKELAEKICRNFSAAVAEFGFFENLCSTEPRGLRAKSHTWTASAYMILTELLNQPLN